MSNTINTRVLWAVLSLMAECISCGLFFRSIPRRSEERTNRPAYLLLLLLGLLFLLPENVYIVDPSVYSLGNYFNQFLRMLLHWLVVAVFLRAEKLLNTRSSLFFSGINTLIYLAFQNLRVVGVLLFRQQGLENLGMQVTGVLFVLLRPLSSWLLPQRLHLERARNAAANEWLALFAVSLLQIFLKWTLITVDNNQLAQPHFASFILFAGFSSLCVASIPLVNEAYRVILEDRNALRMQRMSDAYEMQNAKRALQTNNDIRRLYHDIKNHIVAIQSLAGEQEELQAYLRELLPSVEDYETQVATGNQVIDALLAEKIQRAYLDRITFNICLDLRCLAFMRTVDLISIFGNAIDNAIEAEQMLPEEAARIIFCKSSVFAGSVILRFSNRFAGAIRQQDGKLLTGKQNTAEHGIGLDSIRHAVERYGGNVESRFDNAKGVFDLVLMIPLEEK